MSCSDITMPKRTIKDQWKLIQVPNKYNVVTSDMAKTNPLTTTEIKQKCIGNCRSLLIMARVINSASIFSI